MIAGISKVKWGSDEIKKVMWGNDEVYNNSGGIVKDLTIEEIIREYPTVQALIQLYPHLYNRIYEYPMLLFSLVNLDEEEEGSKYNLFIIQTDDSSLPFITAVPSADFTVKMEGYLLYNGSTAIRFLGSRTGFNSVDDIMCFINTNKWNVRLGGVDSAQNASFDYNSNSLNKFVIYNKYYNSNNGTSSTEIYTNGVLKYSQTRKGYINNGKPLALMGTYDGANYYGNSNNLWVKKIQLNNHTYIPFENKLYDINADTFLTAQSNNAFSCVVYDETTNTQVENPSIELLLKYPVVDVDAMFIQYPILNNYCTMYPHLRNRINAFPQMIYNLVEEETRGWIYSNNGVFYLNFTMSQPSTFEVDAVLKSDPYEDLNSGSGAAHLISNIWGSNSQWVGIVWSNGGSIGFNKRTILLFNRDANGTAESKSISGVPKKDDYINVVCDNNRLYYYTNGDLLGYSDKGTQASNTTNIKYLITRTKATIKSSHFKVSLSGSVIHWLIPYVYNGTACIYDVVSDTIYYYTKEDGSEATTQYKIEKYND